MPSAPYDMADNHAGRLPVDEFGYTSLDTQNVSNDSRP